ncbi:8240401d-6c40-43cd-a661-6df2218d238b [Thermothielavioides terrestris]|uniref:8240401d-6c40-43cd-a661-6df2218d238b n=1 Tax=Thermothielavioides terrestris TaxID=2587410 RepID=A0A446BP66_9PEZI|nr:8240401d-6c40-43cd-a661-6df2218d238b [Thermothielavioides terrestris]
MTVCRFYQQGYCRYGNACKFEHPPKGGQQNYNRFGVFDSPPYPGLTADAIQRDLTSELPQWILSCYGPGRDAPEQLWGAIRASKVLRR